MRVAIETDFVGGGPARGGTHLMNHLLEQYARLAPGNEYLVFTFFYNDFERKVGQFRLPNSKSIRPFFKRWPQSLVRRLEWGWGLPIIESTLALAGVDVYHCFRAPRWMRERVAVTQNDITPVIRPEWHTPESQRIWRTITLPGLRRAHRIITLCEATKRDMIRELAIPEEKIRITQLGVDHQNFKPFEDRALLAGAREKYGLPERFVLMVGPFDPVTHFRTVVEALLLWRKAGEAPCVVAVGPIDEYVRKLQRMAVESGVAEHFLWTGYVPHCDLSLIYNLATALLYPSRLPGIELPPFEAMACGTPVITSLEENIAEAGILIDADSPENLYRATRKVWESDSLRKDLGARGIARAAQYTWERTARETLAVYREMAQRA